MELGFITVTLILVFISFQQPFYIGINSEEPTYQTTSMLLLVKDVDYVTYKLLWDSNIEKFEVTPIQLTEDNYQMILIKDREIIDFLLDNLGSIMTLEQIETLNNYKERIQRTLAGLDELNSNDIVKMEYYIYQTYQSVYDKYKSDKKNQMELLVKTYKKLKEHQPMARFESMKEELLDEIKSQYLLLKQWVHGMNYYFSEIKPKNYELVQKVNRLVEYKYLYNKATHYYELYKILEEADVLNEDVKKVWDEEIQPVYTEFLRGESLDFDVENMEDFVVSALEGLRSDALLKLEDAREYTVEQEIFPFFEKGRALNQIEELESKIKSYQFDEETSPDTVKEFIENYEKAEGMKNHVKMMYVRDVLAILVAMIVSLYIILNKGKYYPKMLERKW